MRLRLRAVAAAWVCVVAVACSDKHVAGSSDHSTDAHDGGLADADACADASADADAYETGVDDGGGGIAYTKVFDQAVGASRIALFQAASSGDRAILVFERPEGQGVRLMATIYANGVFTTPVAIDPEGASAHDDVYGTLAPSGEVAIVFTHRDASGVRLFGVSTTGGQFGEPVDIGPAAPAAYMLLAFSQSSSGEDAIVAAVATGADGTGELWVTPVYVAVFGKSEPVDGIATGIPELEVAPGSSQAMLCWGHATGAPDKAELHCAFRPAGHGGFPAPVVEATSFMPSYVRVGVSPSGAKALVVYSIQNPTPQMLGRVYHTNKPAEVLASPDTVSLGAGQVIFLASPERAFIACSGADLGQNEAYVKWAMLRDDDTFLQPAEYGSIGDVGPMHPRWTADSKRMRAAAIWGWDYHGPYLSEYRDDAMQTPVTIAFSDLSYFGQSDRILTMGNLRNDGGTYAPSAAVVTDGLAGSPVEVLPGAACGWGGACYFVLVPSLVAPTVLALMTGETSRWFARIDDGANVARAQLCPDKSAVYAVALAPSPKFLGACLAGPQLQVWELQ